MSKYTEELRAMFERWNWNVTASEAAAEAHAWCLRKVEMSPDAGLDELRAQVLVEAGRFFKVSAEDFTDFTLAFIRMAGRGQS